MKKRVHYEVRDADGEVITGSFLLRTARRQAALELREDGEVSIVKVTTEDVPLKAKKVKP